ncbi:Pectinesterase [Heracleum sosnowskyi]|uniref:Pectinesterase n=1 Tax=Heracleum sosnowskyi TaxID=360622 RepID=A0AAD8JH87_9APIA|nr:Pectinesterase [Heracleum sosnowskyi]
MDSLINPAGWREWSGDFALSTLYYAELGNTGLGSKTKERVTWPGFHKIRGTQGEEIDKILEDALNVVLETCYQSVQGQTGKAADDLASSDGTTQTYLGRPWKEYSRTIYIQSFMDSLISPAGWREWSGNFASSTLYYAEFDNTGPGSGSVTRGRVTWPGYHTISATEAANFTVSNFLLGDNWLPQTGVPYSDGL